MKIRLGRELDGQHGEVVTPDLDSITTGPLGMLNLLETQLGLLRVETPQTSRVLVFHDCLKQMDGQERFYHESFKADPLGTAATLLEWRDLWFLYGWDGSSKENISLDQSRRLRDMMALEATLGNEMPPCLGERLQKLAQEIPLRRPRISRVELCEPLSSWPRSWQVVLEKLPTIDVSNTQGAAPHDTVLGEIQMRLCALRRGEKITPVVWQEDGSLRVVQSETRLLAGSWLATQLASADRAAGINESTLLLAPEAGVLDEVLVAANLPRHGFKENSPFRPALQVVPLGLAQLWQPLNVYSLLEFLTHPICPVPKIVREPLANMLASNPGLGSGPAWDEALRKIRLNCEKTGYDHTKAHERIATWIQHERHSPIEGAPLSTVSECLARLADFFRSHLEKVNEAERIAYASGLGQALACKRAVEALAQQGESHILPQQLETLLQQATAQGAPNPLLKPEVGACRTITLPGAAIDPANHVIWWQLGTPIMPTPWPWSLSEQSTLRALGVALPEVTDLLKEQANAWERPILAAKEQLTLILPPPGEEVHPLWQLMVSLFAPGNSPAIQDLTCLLTAKELDIQPCRPLPTLRTWWELPPGVSIPKRTAESYSSLESFLFNPYQWVLTYSARLRRSSILDVSDGFLLYGNLAHHLVERYVVLPESLNQEEQAFDAWFDQNFEQILKEEGTVLQLPGRWDELMTFRRRLYRALRQLRLHLRNAGVVKVESEIKLSGHFIGGVIEGYGDLLLTRSDGTQAIVDMKWAGGKKYPEKLAQNRHLQLAIYGELLRQKTGKWPHLAYYLINDADLIATNQDFFPSARVIRKNKDVSGEGNADLWQRFLKTWAWRREQLDQGLIQVCLDTSDTTEFPSDGMAPEILNMNYNDYLALAGWGDQA